MADIRPQGKAQLTQTSRINEHLGTYLKAFRLQKGITQEQLGNAIGVTFQQVQKYEKGANRMSCETLYKIAVYLDVPIEKFFEKLCFKSDFTQSNKIKDVKQHILHEPLSKSLSYQESEEDRALSASINLLLANLALIKDDEVREKILGIIQDKAL